RQVLVSITAKGRVAVEGTLRQRTKSLVELVEKLSGEERRALAAALPALWKLADNDPGTWPRIHVGRPPRRRRGLLVALPADCFVSLTISQRGARGPAFG